jgi:hypothetical protein
VLADEPVITPADMVLVPTDFSTAGELLEDDDEDPAKPVIPEALELFEVSGKLESTNGEVVVEAEAVDGFGDEDELNALLLVESVKLEVMIVPAVLELVDDATELVEFNVSDVFEPANVAAAESLEVENIVGSVEVAVVDVVGIFVFIESVEVESIEVDSMEVVAVKAVSVEVVAVEVPLLVVVDVISVLVAVEQVVVGGTGETICFKYEPVTRIQPVIE